MRGGFAYLSPYILSRGLPSPRLDCLPASPHRLTTASSGRAQRSSRPEGSDEFWALSITRFVMGAVLPVREYQPVVHRLRLSASPKVPTYPGRISLAQEPLVIRRGSFSLPFRYSCLHSHSCAVHGWVTPPLLSAHDAPLPIHTPGRPLKGTDG
jgi:hypothetical protein